MQKPPIKTLFFIGLLFGAGVVMAATTFAPGDAGQVSDGVTFESPSGTETKLWGTTNVSMGDVFPNSTTHSSQFADRSVILNTSDGNITLASDNDVHGEVHTSNMTGTWTNVTSITAGGNTLEIYPENKQRVDVKGDVDNISIASMTVDDGNVDFVVGGTNGGVATVTIYNLPASTTIAANDDGTFLDQATTDANGKLTLDIPVSTHDVELQTVDPDTPTISDEQPQGTIPGTPSEINATVKDPDFPNDDVQVTFYLDGSQIAQKNITSNGTVSTSNYGNLDLGEHSYNISAVDNYGNTATSNQTFSLPQNITLRNESDASEVIKDKNITATFYGVNGQTIIERSDSNEDGNISLRGLPDVSFVVTFEGDGWYDRRAFIESIGDQQNIYLLNSTAYPTGSDDAIETTFIYEDRTGSFDQNSTTLEIERAVDPDDDGNFTWQVVAGDYWGAAGEFPMTGQYQERYRLRVTNQETGETRVLGTHIPTSDGVKNIIVGNIIFDAENATGKYWDAGLNPNTTTLQAYYQDPTNSTTDLRVLIYEQGNRSNELVNQTFAGPVGDKLVTVSVSDSQAEKNWVVEWDGTDDDGAVHGEALVGGVRYALPIDPVLLTAFGFSFVTFVMALYGPRVSTMGAWAGVITYAGLMFIGWLPFTIAGLTVATLAATGGTLYKEAMPS